MSPVTVAIIALIVFLIFAFNGMPIAFAFGVVGTAGLVYLRGWAAGFSILGQIPYAWATQATLICMPLFILMGMFAFHSKISQDLYQTANKWFGRLPGGIALATNLASTGFAACCGVSMAGAATMASIAYPEMERFKYDRRLSTGCIVAGGGLSSLIPPSLGFIIYGILAEQSIAVLFIAGILPGVMLSSMFLLTIFITCKRNPALGAPGQSYTWPERIKSLKGVWGMMLLFVIVMGGLYIGVFTPSEAGAAGACGAFLIGLVTRRLNFAATLEALKATMKTACFILTMIIGANVFNTFIGITGLADEFSYWLTSVELPRYLILVCILVIYIPLGMFLDIGAVLLLTIPIFIPPLMALGFDPIWLGVLIILVAEIGFMTPPVGLNAFIVHGVTKVPLHLIFRGITPFVIMMLIGVIILVIFPEITLFLPGIMH